MKKIWINIKEDNLRTFGFSRDGNINLREAGIDTIYDVDEIKEFLIDKQEAAGDVLLEENIFFEDFAGEKNQKEKINAMLSLKEKEA